MKRQKTNSIIIFLLAALVWACNSKPKVIEGQPILSQANMQATAHQHSGFKFPDAQTKVSQPSLEHEIVVKEVLNTERYSYLRVKEGEEEFWVAVSKQSIEEGGTYLFSGGLLKKNFFSREFDRVFDTVYLVSTLRQKQSTNAVSEQKLTSTHIPKAEALPALEVGTIQPTEGAITLAELFANKTAYAGKLVKITGKCVKLNPKIMNRNWVHLQDGSGEGLDLTITTNEVIRLGDIVSLEGTIALDRDFGAGYRYDIIMEGAKVK